MSPVNVNQKFNQMKRNSGICPHVRHDFQIKKRRLINIFFKYLQDPADYSNLYYLNLPLTHQIKAVVTIQTIAYVYDFKN